MSVWREQVENDFVKNINDTYILNLAISILEDREDFREEIERLNKELAFERQIKKEVREYITSYESIETIQQFDHNKNNKDLDYSTIDEMTRRYMIVHDKILEILDKVEDKEVDNQ